MMVDDDGDDRGGRERVAGFECYVMVCLGAEHCSKQRS